MKLLQELTLMDNFLFGAVMQNADICRMALEAILNVEIKDITYPELEKTIDIAYDSKSVRLDVYVADDENTIYNIEIQATNKKNLPRRIRYYNDIIDLNVLNKGEDYNALKKSVVIFICNYDEFGYDKHIYTFRNICEELPGLHLNDDTTKIVLNTKGTANDVSPQLQDFLDVLNGERPKTELGEYVFKEAENVKKNEEWEREYMTLFMRDKEKMLIGSYGRLVKIVRGQYNKGLDVKSISDLNFEDIATIEKIVDLIQEHPDWDDERIAEEFNPW